jgi:hypothetical protein
MSHQDTAPFTAAFLNSHLNHRDALELRRPGIAPTGCAGVLVYRREAAPGAHYSPLVYRCAQCGDVLCLDQYNDAALWVETSMESAAGRVATDSVLFDRLLDIARRFEHHMTTAFKATEATIDQYARLYNDTVNAVAVADGRAEYLHRGRRPTATLDIDDDPETDPRTITEDLES